MKLSNVPSKKTWEYHTPPPPPHTHTNATYNGNVTKPEYIAKKSIWAVLSIWHILLFPLIIVISLLFFLTSFSFLKLFCCIMIWAIPCLSIGFKIYANKKTRIEFYHDKIVIKTGVFSISERQSAFMGVLAVRLNQSLFGRLFKYGNIYVDVPGKWDVYATTYIINPERLKEYLLTKIVSVNNTQSIVMD